jgi:heme/copper-type cytochrome/quinol oxidase subunit 3
MMSESEKQLDRSFSVSPLRQRFGSPPPINNSIRLIGSRSNVYRAKLIFYLFLASLAVFFCAGLVSYWIIRTQSFQPISREYLSLQLPQAFWISTIALVFISGCLQLAVWCIRREYQVAFRRWLIAAWVSAIAFLVIQYAGMNELWETHFTSLDGSTKVYGICFTMVFLHALHVVGGLVFLGWIIFQGYRGRYDHERNYAVEHCAAYWHFLDVVWLAMLLLFLFTG